MISGQCIATALLGNIQDLINLGIIEMSFGELQESNPGPIGEKR